MLEITNLVKTFCIDNNHENDKKALKGINLTINDDDFITVIGGNGSGKTTLLNCIAGTIECDMGKIMLTPPLSFKDDEDDAKMIDITNMQEHKRAKYIGRVFQDPMLGTVASMSLVQNMSLASSRGSVPNLLWSETIKKREQFIELVKPLSLGLENRLDSLMSSFSGGQRQSITLLMATMNTPALLLLDEHTAALDPKTALKVMTLTDNIVKEKRIPTLMITHNMKDAIKYGNRLIMMSEGRIIFEASGEAKKKLTIEQLIEKFNQLGEGHDIPDSMILG